MNNIEYFEKAIDEAKLRYFLVSTFDEAKEIARPFSVVYYPNAETGLFDVYLTAKKNGRFGEMVCWTEAEFEEDESLLATVTDFLVSVLKAEDKESKIKEWNKNIAFTPY